MEEQLQSIAIEDGGEDSGVQRVPIEELLKLAESSTLEFKESARWSHINGDATKASELEVIKNVAGFLNSRGGTLVIGVNDQKAPTGLKEDYKSIQGHPDRDGFENWLTNIMQNAIGAAALGDVSISFETVGKHELCRIDVYPGSDPVFVSWKGESQFYVRLNNSTRRLNLSEYETTGGADGSVAEQPCSP